jgi:hypothetical protein
VKCVCVDVSGALLLLPEGFRCTLGIFFLWGFHFIKLGDFVYSVGFLVWSWNSVHHREFLSAVNSFKIAVLANKLQSSPGRLGL